MIGCFLSFSPGFVLLLAASHLKETDINFAHLDVGQGEPVGSVSFPIGVVWLKRVEEDMALAT